MDIGAATHPGYVRSGNEDGFFASREQAVFAVADGMGGHAHGEIASHLALETIARYADTLSTAPSSELASDLHTAIQAANTAILSQAVEQEARNRMGTTLVVATICGDRLYFAHIGDSRLYLLRGDIFTQLTRDHSLVQTMVDRGEISQEEAAIHPLRHQITRVVGGDNRVSPEIASQALQPGDIILLCTDGLSGAADAETIKQILASNETAQHKADALIQAALDAGGPDNITAVVVSYQRPRPVEKNGMRKKASESHHGTWLTMLLTVCGVVVFLAALVSWQYWHPSYLIASDTQNVLHMYKHWPLLPMLAKEEVPTPGVVEVSLTDAYPFMGNYLPKDGNMHEGVRVDGKDAGVATLNDIAKMTAAGLLANAKSALEHSDVAGAQKYLTRAKQLHADPELTAQLELQLKLLGDDKSPAPAEMKASEPTLATGR
ncbi:MAG TPA: Stp1/IreP family PP2C-type Ser/Thr phosphatase [Armatimonadota bacterium]|nr:Stp1/IreP family PP2C-type Ser/Thr phosphatase [Armatimonadota bacterium]